MQATECEHCRHIGAVLIGICLLCPAAATAQESEQPPLQEAVPANPLSDLLRRVFGGGNDRDAGTTPDGETDGSGDAEGLPSASSEEGRRLAHIEKAIAAGDWLYANRLMQEILDRPQDSLIEGPDGRTTSLHAEVEDRIGRLPPAGLQAYRAEYEALAARLLQQAQRTGDLELTADVANRYFHTDSGKQAANLIASTLFDRGAYRAAASWYARLADVSEYRSSPEWARRAAYGLALAGRGDDARRLLESAGETGTLPSLDADATLKRWITDEANRTRQPPRLDDWFLPYGTAAHVGVVRDGVPLLLQRWSFPLTSRYAVEEQLRRLLLDASDHERAAIPAVVPIAVGGRVVCRTLRGVAVFDVHEGELQWEVEAPYSAERLLSGETPTTEVVPWNFGPVFNDANSNFEQHQLISLLFRDAGYGLVSSDGRRVYAIEQSVLMPPVIYGYWWGNNDPASQDPLKRDWSSNQIHAFDLYTGERLWEVGGRWMEEPFDPPLAGAFFFGPPVPDGEELFAVGERDNEISLYVLAAETGELLWSQPLAEATTPVARDFVRRMWACLPGVDEGLIVCPTTAGWLVAVDRHTHRIVWAHCYAAQTSARRFPGGVAMHSLQPLNERWCQAAPILAGGRVVFTPSEQPDETGQDQPRLVCLDARTGEQVWERSKGNSLYLAGVFGERVLVVGKHEIVAVALADGRVLWTLAIPTESGPPSGRGVAVGEDYLVPLESGEVWTIDMASGTLRRRARLPHGSEGVRLGNLVMHQGRLLSLGPFGLVGFEQQVNLQREIADRLQADGGDLWAAVKQAEILLVSADHAGALAALDRAHPDAAADAALRERHRRLTFDTLLNLVRSDPAQAEAARRAATLPANEEERLEFDRVELERRIAVGDWKAACELAVAMPHRYAADQMLTDGDITRRLDVWLGGRLAQIDAQAPPDVRETLEASVRSALADAPLVGREAASLERLYGFHPAIREFSWQVMEAAAKSGDFAGAEARLRRMIDSGDRATAAAALARLAELLIAFDQPADAAACLARLEQEFGAERLPDGRTAQETARAAFDSGRVNRASLQAPKVAAWSDQEFEIRHYRVVNADYSMTLAPVMRRGAARFFRDHHVEFDSDSPAMTITRQSDGSSYWSLPLRAAESQAYSQSAAVIGHGLQMVVLHRGMLHALSLPDRRLLWSRNAAENGPGVFMRQVYQDDIPALQPGNIFVSRQNLARERSETGLLAVANARYVACYGRGEFVVLDSLTGELLWRCRGVSRQTLLYGNSDTIYVIGSEESYALRAADGHRLPQDGIQELARTSVAITRHGFVQVEKQPARRRSNGTVGQITVAGVDPGGQPLWSREFATASRLALLDETTLLVLEEPTGQCVLVELESGSVHPMGQVAVDLIKRSPEIVAVHDAEHVYLVFNHLEARSIGYVHPPAVRASGTIVALSRAGGGVVWEQKVESQNLLLTHFERCPLMVFLTYEHVHLPDLGADYAKMHLMVLEKGTGRIVAREESASPSGGYYRIDFNRRQRAIDIHSHNERIRIQAVGSEQTASTAH